MIIFEPRPGVGRLALVGDTQVWLSTQPNTDMTDTTLTTLTTFANKTYKRLDRWVQLSRDKDEIRAADVLEERGLL